MDKKKKDEEIVIPDPIDMEVMPAFEGAVAPEISLEEKKMSDTAPIEIPKEIVEQAKKVVEEAKKAKARSTREDIHWVWNSFKNGTYQREVPKYLSNKRLKKAKQKERRAIPLPKNFFKRNLKEEYNNKKKLERMLSLA